MIVSVGLAYGPGWDGKVAEIDAKIPIDGDRLGLVAGAASIARAAPMAERRTSILPQFLRVMRPIATSNSLGSPTAIGTRTARRSR